MGCVESKQHERKISQKRQLNCIQKSYDLAIPPSSSTSIENNIEPSYIQNKWQNKQNPSKSDPQLYIKPLQKPDGSSQYIEHAIKRKNGIQPTQSKVVQSNMKDIENASVTNAIKKQNVNNNQLISNIKEHPYIFENQASNINGQTPMKSKIKSKIRQNKYCESYILPQTVEQSKIKMQQQRQGIQIVNYARIKAPRASKQVNNIPSEELVNEQERRTGQSSTKVDKRQYSTIEENHPEEGYRNIEGMKWNTLKMN